MIAVDYDGKALQSKIVTLDPDDKNLKFNVHPNPASDLIEIKITGADKENQNLSVSIYNFFRCGYFNLSCRWSINDKHSGFRNDSGHLQGNPEVKL